MIKVKDTKKLKVKNTVGPWSITETILVKVRFEARN